ncbi:MAG: phasin family protein [Thermoanaerobaculia bacterium]
MNGIQTGMEAGATVDRLISAGRNLWLAGLGVVAGVEETGLQMFDRLVERGRPVQERQKEKIEKVAERAQQTARGLGQLVTDTVEFESRGVLKKLNLMTREDVKILTVRVEALSKKIDEYVARRLATAVEIVSPEGETAAIVIPENIDDAPKPKTARPRRKTAR